MDVIYGLVVFHKIVLPFQEREGLRTYIVTENRKNCNGATLIFYKEM